MKNRIIFVSCIFISIIVFIFLFKPSCPLFNYTGLSCCFCGCTRATFSLLNGNFFLALSYNPFYIISLPYLILKTIEIIYIYVKYNTFKFSSDIIAFIIIASIFMIMRNVL